MSPQKKELKFIDLFSGIGGFRLGLERNGFKCVWSCENNKWSNMVYDYQFGGKNNETRDIRNVDKRNIPDHDILCAGFPCQSFSIAGKRKGFNDPRGTLFFEICKIARIKRPPFLLLENVKGLLSHERGRTFGIILNSLEELGYEVEWQVIDSQYYGVPQHRERVFIIGHLGGFGGQQIFPIQKCNEILAEKNKCEQGEEERIQSKDIVSTIDSRYGALRISGETYINDPKPIIMHRSGDWNNARLTCSDIAFSILQKFSTDNCQFVVKPCLTPDRPEKRQNGRRFKEDGDPAFTLTGSDVHGISINDEIRRLTPMECERLQGFPDHWTKYGLNNESEKVEISDTQRYNLIGNAVTVNVLEFLGNEIKKKVRVE